MYIRNAAIDDLNKIAKTHIECFPDIAFEKVLFTVSQRVSGAIFDCC